MGVTLPFGWFMGARSRFTFWGWEVKDLETAHAALGCPTPASASVVRGEQDRWGGLAGRPSVAGESFSQAQLGLFEKTLLLSACLSCSDACPQAREGPSEGGTSWGKGQAASLQLQ